MGSYIKVPGGSGMSEPIHPLAVVLVMLCAVIGLEMVGLVVMIDGWYVPPPLREITYSDSDLSYNLSEKGECETTGGDAQETTCTSTGTDNIAIGYATAQEETSGTNNTYFGRSVSADTGDVGR